MICRVMCSFCHFCRVMEPPEDARAVDHRQQLAHDRPIMGRVTVQLHSLLLLLRGLTCACVLIYLWLECTGKCSQWSKLL